jgi:hypothetical protein
VSDATVNTSGIAQLLGRHQREVARRREAALEDSTVSLYRRLGLDDPELAEAYDRSYGRPTSTT